MTAVCWLPIGFVALMGMSLLLGGRFPLLRSVGTLAFFALFLVLGVGAIVKGNVFIAVLEISVFIILISVYLWARLYAKRRLSQTRNIE